MSELLNKAKGLVDKVTDATIPDATLTDIDFKRISLDSVQFLAKVSVYNPHFVPLPISEISYQLKSGDEVIASGTIPDPGNLKARDTTMVDVPVKVPYTIILSLTKDIVADWDIDYELEVGLIIDVPAIGNFTIPLSIKGEAKLPTLCDLF
ncbi:Late embryogenesis abundant protein Lea14-A [Quillaja saponaria]|uniref:Late embryogenesis abundant protein Lea14-A n=1 Tax=Quillaja saponaria TaxID=32244 RepID=A0AAD7LQG9_QUISA|nr:Late embryogenesis abundant protein Lea14-A [Quillaja saponaria]